MYHSRGVPQWTCMTSTTPIPILLICMSISDHEQAMYVCMSNRILLWYAI